MDTFLKRDKVWVISLCVSSLCFLVFGFVLAKILVLPPISNDILIRNPVVDKDNYSQGSILIVPALGKGDVGLLNKKGHFEKLWSVSKPTIYGELMKDNKLLLVHRIDNPPLPTNTGLIAVYSEEGQLETSFQDRSLHHDIAIKNLSQVFALSRHIRGVKYKGKTVKVIDESVIEIDLKTKKIIRKIALLDLLSIPDKLTGEVMYYGGMLDIFHGNGIDYIEANPINGHPAVLVTLRKYHKGAIILIDLKTDQLLWKSPKGLFLYPHDGKFTKDKTITVFDNGDTSNVWERLSRVVEMDIRTNEIIWEYDGTVENSPMIKQFFQWQMFSPWVSGAQKTEKGYLIVSGMQGRIFEVSKDKKIVWDLPAAASYFRNVYGTLSIPLFKARQYDENRFD